MKVFSTRLALWALGLALLPCPRGAWAGAGAAHDPRDSAVEDRAGGSDARATDRTTARPPATSPESLVPAYVIRALEHGWDVDGNPETVTDTLVIPVGSTVRWQVVSGIHTLTNGGGAGDPDAGSRFDYLLDEQHPRFDSTFTAPDTVEYFCFFHEPRMRGLLVVSGSASVPEDRLPSRVAFTRPPRPNPSRGTVSFDIGMAHDQKVRVEVLDLLGSRVALLHDGPLAAGQHPFRWRGVTDRGERTPAGIYIVQLRSGAVTTSRPVSVLR